jgi:hypothetical protein
MKRTIPGGRVESIYTQSKNGKEVIATTVTPVDTEEEVAITEETETPETAVEEEPESKEQ